jgi:rubrerythrin
MVKPSRTLAAKAWAFRRDVELDAEARFRRMAERLVQVDALPEVVELAKRASDDERRHAKLCADLAQDYGAELTPSIAPPSEIAPPRLAIRERVLYEVVAACCVTETESTGVLTTLLSSLRSGKIERVLRELLRDEVGHSRLGWAHLAHESGRGPVQYLGPLIPYMLEGSIPPGLFSTEDDEQESSELLQHGVLPLSLKRSVFSQTLEQVVFPGLERLGVDSAPARLWLERQQDQLRA